MEITPESLLHLHDEEDEQKRENNDIKALIIKDENMSYTEEYFKRKRDEELAKQREEVSQHLLEMCGFEPNTPEPLDTDELIKKMHEITKKELEK